MAKMKLFIVNPILQQALGKILGAQKKVQILCSNQGNSYYKRLLKQYSSMEPSRHAMQQEGSGTCAPTSNHMLSYVEEIRKLVP